MLARVPRSKPEKAEKCAKRQQHAELADDQAMHPPIYVTQPFLPPLEEFQPYLAQIWANKILTNGGPFHQQLEGALCDYLGVKHLALCANATMGLVMALQALEIADEVITTPYSFVATANSLLWNGLQPVFVDIDPQTLNIDPEKIKSAITPRTKAILAVHCYGNPCTVEAIEAIAAEHKLKVIYDAAHAFGVKHRGQSVLHHGDLSVVSFHATKVFNTFEGGAIVCPDLATKQHIDHLKNFGFINETTVVASGINGKMSEFNAALGLLQLKHVERALSQRQAVDLAYRQALEDVPGLSCLQKPANAQSNHAYFPVLVDESYPLSRDELHQKFNDHNIFTRRYFYPLISNFPMYKNMPSANPANLPFATSAAEKVLCLPIYPGLSTDDQNRIIQIIRDN
jgi:dTDP-4-amino-4,6-dideoxygalactose transaminase